MRLLVDMNLTPRWVDLLTKAGFEAVHWSVVGTPDAPDSDLMSHAKTHPSPNSPAWLMAQLTPPPNLASLPRCL